MAPSVSNSHDRELTPELIGAEVEPETDSGPAKAGRGGGKAATSGEVPERRCIATMERRPQTDMIRFVRSPDGEAVPDIAARLPGRGAWVTANRAAVDVAVKRQAFSRAFKAQTSAPADLSDRVEALLARRALDSLGLVRKSGDLILGFDQVDAEIRSGRCGYLVAAADGSEDGRGKLSNLLRGVQGENAREMAVPTVFSADELGMALGRGRVIHAWLKQGRFAQVWIGEIARLAGFRQVGKREAPLGEAGGPADTSGGTASGVGRPEDS